MTCVHAWLIAPPNGTYSLGVCRKCGAERQFLNVMEQDVDTSLVNRPRYRSGVRNKFVKGNAAYFPPPAGVLSPVAKKASHSTPAKKTRWLRLVPEESK